MTNQFKSCKITPHNEVDAGFNQQINAPVVNTKFISSVRKKLNLKQREASELFGGRVNVFTCYENGPSKPSLGLVDH